MMQFIVLGQIPGTHFQLTIWWYGAILAIIMLAGMAVLYYVHGHKVRKHLQQQFDIISLSSLDRA